jgi:hypothetical protein
MSPVEIRLGYSENEFLLIGVLHREFPQNEDYWDGNWLVATVEVAVGAFRGEVKGYLRTDEFIAFRQEVVELYTRLTGTARFSTMEGWLTIQLTGDGLGHIVADCVLRDEPGTGNKLEFTLEFDQSYLPNILKGLTQVTQTFPIVGRPPA